MKKIIFKNEKTKNYKYPAASNITDLELPFFSFYTSTTVTGHKKVNKLTHFSEA